MQRQWYSSLLYNQSIDLTWMITVTTLYLITTAALFTYTLHEHSRNSDGYFAAMLSYMSDQANLFIIYNVILSLAIVLYKIYVFLFLERTMEGEVMKITDKLKMKLLDVIFFSYVIQLRFDFQVYLVLVVLIFLFILHTHVILRSEYLVHVHTTSTSLNQHYKLLALFLMLFFFDYQVLKFSGVKMLLANVQSQVLFVYYMFSTSAILAEPFMQFAVDFYEKYTFTHFKNSDQFLAMAGLIINIPRLVIQLLLSIWISYKFWQPFFFIISGIDNISQLTNAFESFSRVRKLTSSMQQLKKVKGEQLQQFHDLTCTVCYDDMKEAVMLPCKHIFHEECIRQWIIKNLNNFCPKCKRQFNFDNITEEYKPVVPQEQPQQDFNQFRAFVGNEQNNQRNGMPSHKEPLLPQEAQRQYNHQQAAQIPLIHKRRQQMEREQTSLQEPVPTYNQFTILNGKKEAIPARSYIIDRPDLSEMPLQFYDAMKRKVVPVGSLPYGMPTIAVSNRTHLHMQKRRQYSKELQVVLRLMNMNRNEQLLFL